MSLSVIVPTLNCADQTPAHVESMRAWADLAAEIIVVDSESDDGTPELIREGLPHPALRIISRPRGLYQAWNHGLSQTIGDWIYISTIGDTITREHLLHLLECGETLGADVVVSPPRFEVADHVLIKPPDWPVMRLLRFLSLSEPAPLPAEMIFFFAMAWIPEAILGSSASNVYRGGHMRARPFPTEYCGAGDTAWTLRHSLETRYCLTPRCGSVFRLHSASYGQQDPVWWQNLCESLARLGRATLERLASDRAEGTASDRVLLLLDSIQRLGAVRERAEAAHKAWGVARKASRIPWYFRPAAVRARAFRNACRREFAVENAGVLDVWLGMIPREIGTRRPANEGSPPP